MFTPEEGFTGWKYTRVNPRIRLLAYNKGGYFKAHEDGH
jgi:hypothetical protein